MPTTQTALALHVRLTLADREIGGMFRECSGLDSETEVTEQRSVDESGQPVVRKVAGATKWSNITLRRGIDQNRDLWEWRNVVHREGAEAARTDGTIELIDYEGSPIATYRFAQGWPAKYTAAALAATESEIAIESVEICVESVERV
jgi:phage tail-like protein